MSGIVVALNLGKWLLGTAIMTEAGHENEWAGSDFLTDGRDIYRAYFEAVHTDGKVDRKMRKAEKKWTKFSRKRLEKLAKETPPDVPNPFEYSASIQYVREWALNGTPIDINAPELLPDGSEGRIGA